MSSEISYDPVSAVDESDASGAVAETFKDIRQTMYMRKHKLYEW